MAVRYTISEAESCTHTELGLPLPGDAHWRQRKAYGYWDQKRGDRLGPTWSEIDPLDIPDLLSSMLVIDREPEADRFVYRLAGTGSYEIHKMELTGRDIATLRPASFADHLLADLRKMVEDRLPQFVRLEFLNRAGLRRSYSVLRMPILHADGTLDKAMIFADNSRFLEQV